MLLNGGFYAFSPRQVITLQFLILQSNFLYQIYRREREGERKRRRERVRESERKRERERVRDVERKNERKKEREKE